MVTPLEGMPAPDFSLATDQGRDFALSRHRGGPVVLFFYPQDETEGCTTENLEFSALAPEFAKLGAIVVGISPDTVESHCKFRDKHALKILLVSDPDLVAIRAFGLWQMKKLYGREYEGLVRTSFIIAPDGRIARVIKATRIKNHAAAMLAELTALSAKWSTP